jgi:N-acetylglucosamine malate deacetylase 1
MIDVLAIFAHPDDVELYVGGTLLKLKSFGLRTGVLDVTRGEMGTRGTPEIRAKESEDAAKILKLDVRENLDLPDGHVWLTEETRTKMVRVLRRLKPKVLFTHQLNDSHPDHDHIANLVREAARLASLRKYDPESGKDRIPAPIVAHTVFSRLVVPSFIVDVSDFANGKMDALKEPETMLTSKRFFSEIEAKMTYFGSLIGVEAGEPFYVREALNIENPFELLTRPMNIYS